jgi:putative phosphoribosyl transferase
LIDRDRPESTMNRRFAIDALAIFASLTGATAARCAEPAANFLRDVKPILAQRCYQCHGPDEAKGGLRLNGHDAALAELAERAQTCRAGRAPLALEGRTVILVDCGIRTGSTMKAAIIALQKLRPARIIGAAPVASRAGSAAIASLCDDLISLSQPEIFVNAGYWYRDFRRPGDDQVGELLA